MGASETGENDTSAEGGDEKEDGFAHFGFFGWLWNGRPGSSSNVGDKDGVGVEPFLFHKAWTHPGYSALTDGETLWGLQQSPYLGLRALYGHFYRRMGALLPRPDPSGALSPYRSHFADMKKLPLTLLAVLFLGPGCSMIGGRVVTEQTTAPSPFIGRLGGVTAAAWDAESRALWIATRNSGLERWVSGSPPVRLGGSKLSLSSLTVDGAGVIVADRGKGRLVRFDRRGIPGEVLASTFQGASLGDARALAAHPAGSLYLLDAKGALLRLDRAGLLEQVELPAPAICITVHGSQLFVGLEKQPGIWVLDLDQSGAPRQSASWCFSLEETPRALGVDGEGALLLGLGNRVERYTRAGVLMGDWVLRDAVTAITVGGEEGRTAFLATASDLYRVQLPSSFGE